VSKDRTTGPLACPYTRGIETVVTHNRIANRVRFSAVALRRPAIGNSTPHSWEIAFRSSHCFDTPHDREYTFCENINKQVMKMRSVQGSLRLGCL
jgi:hypothetical protein